MLKLLNYEITYEIDGYDDSPVEITFTKHESDPIVLKSNGNRICLPKDLSSLKLVLSGIESARDFGLCAPFAA